MKRRPELLPVVVLAVGALALLKAGGAWIGFASASAGQIEDAAPAPVAPSDVVPPKPSADGAERRLLEQLAERRGALDAREGEIATREQLLVAAEMRLEERFAALDAREAEIAVADARALERESADYDALSGAYERMKPRDAAQIFDSLDEKILVPLAAGMRTQALSGVLAQMNPDKARRLTILLADRSEKQRAASLAGPK